MYLNTYFQILVYKYLATLPKTINESLADLIFTSIKKKTFVVRCARELCGNLLTNTLPTSFFFLIIFFFYVICVQCDLVLLGACDNRRSEVIVREFGSPCTQTTNTHLRVLWSPSQNRDEHAVNQVRRARNNSVQFANRSCRSDTQAGLLLTSSKAKIEVIVFFTAFYKPQECNP